MGEDKKSLNYAGCYGEYEYNYNNAEKELLLAVQSKNVKPTIFTQNIAQLKNLYPNDKTFTLCLPKPKQLE